MKEFTGQVFGGPDDGNMVTASVGTIYVENTTILWLDGREVGKTASVVVTRGAYVWQPDKNYFLWVLEGSEVKTTEPAQSA